MKRSLTKPLNKQQSNVSTGSLSGLSRSLSREHQQPQQQQQQTTLVAKQQTKPSISRQSSSQQLQQHHLQQEQQQQHDFDAATAAAAAAFMFNTAAAAAATNDLAAAFNPATTTTATTTSTNSNNGGGGGGGGEAAAVAAAAAAELAAAELAANLAAADPTNASSILQSLPLLLALQAHNQAALNQLNAVVAAAEQHAASGGSSNGGAGTTSGDVITATAASDLFLPVSNPASQKPKVTSNNNRPPSSVNKPINQHGPISSSNTSQQQRLSPGESQLTSVNLVKKRKQIESIGLTSTPTNVHSGSSSIEGMKTSGGVNILNRPKIKPPVPIRKEFDTSQFYPSSLDESSTVRERVSLSSPAHDDEYLWHQQRIELEEQQLKEQLKALSSSSSSTALSSSRSSTTATSSNNTNNTTTANRPVSLLPPSQKMSSVVGGAQQYHNSKRVSTPGPEAMATAMTATMSMKQSSSTSKLNLIGTNNSNLSDIETIFTPVITPVVKSNRMSPLFQQSSQHVKTSSTTSMLDLAVQRSSSQSRNITGGTSLNLGGHSSSKSAAPPPRIPSKVSPSRSSESSGDTKNSTARPSGSGAASTMTIIGTAIECESNQLWICPSCNKPEGSLPMIGCDSCDDWYHWHCIGITKEPPKNQNWYCHKCGSKTTRTAAEETKHEGDDMSESKPASSDEIEKSAVIVAAESEDSTTPATAVTTPDDNTPNESYTSFFNSTFNSSTGSDYLSSLKKKKKKP